MWKLRLREDQTSQGPRGLGEARGRDRHTAGRATSLRTGVYTHLSIQVEFRNGGQVESQKGLEGCGKSGSEGAQAGPQRPGQVRTGRGK